MWRSNVFGSRRWNMTSLSPTYLVPWLRVGVWSGAGSTCKQHPTAQVQSFQTRADPACSCACVCVCVCVFIGLLCTSIPNLCTQAPLLLTFVCTHAPLLLTLLSTYTLTPLAHTLLHALTHLSCSHRSAHLVDRPLLCPRDQARPHLHG